MTDIWPTLKPGGLLIYSTCTLNQYEDEENVRWIAEELGAEVLPLSIKEDWAIKGNLLSGNSFPVYHFLQGYTRGEGFFLAVLRKRKDSVQTDEKEISVCSKVKNKKKKDKQPNIEIPEFCKRWIKCPDSYDFQVQDEGVVVIPQSYKSHLEMLRKTVNVIQAGVMLAGYVFYRIGWTAEMGLANSLWFAAFGAVFGTLGDLMESLLKRTLGIIVALHCFINTRSLIIEQLS